MAAPFPPPPVNTIDWSNVGFRVREVNGHVEATFSRATGSWSPLRFVTDPYMRIHGMAPALNYGQQAYEGLKAFRGPGDGDIGLFRPQRNAARLQHSADVVSMPHVPPDLFVRACRAAVALNAGFVPPHETGAAMYVRPQLYGSSAQLGLAPPEEYTFAVFVIPTGVYHGSHPVRALVLDEFDRAAPNGTGHAKVGGNYAPVLRWSDAARRDGFDITLHLDSARHEEVDEFSTSGFIGVLRKGDDDDDDDDDDEDVTLVVPDSRCAIDSVTSDSVLAIGRSFGWKTDRRTVLYTDLPSFSEVIAAGTAAALVPIRSITRRLRKGLLAPGARVSCGGGGGGGGGGDDDDEHEEPFETVTYIPDHQKDAGPVCLRLLTRLKAIQLGKVPDEFGWRMVVDVADSEIEGGAANHLETLTLRATDMDKRAIHPYSSTDLWLQRQIMRNTTLPVSILISLATMLLSKFVLFLTASLASAAAVDVREAKAQTISSVLEDVSQQTEALGTAVSSWDGSFFSVFPIVGKSSGLYASLMRGSRVAKESKPLSQEETLEMASKTQELSDKVKKTIQVLVEAKPKFQKLFLRNVIRVILMMDKKAADDMIANIIEKIPKDLQTLATEIVKGIQADFANAIAAYS
ncbi:hypothetical protein L249_7002 [Ophiocordyceps polyrhachis-furcata BCC 54312]|uniref:Uncharacterized protein n=1 Tax=Ophiocordyceps polyrhachis-furcata BCC 54312 TaxID=1330021 RepID=A0A367LLN5_9HYPO|nr:hypothetical protein L249_7002 [Ophiocordyceps polyrhachis-furcata BCC 54312]